MSDAAYALGTVLAVQLAVHFPQRRLLVIYAGMFTLGSVLAATAFTPGLFIAGHVIQDLFTSMMLIAAVPALVLGWPTSRLPTTAMIMNLGIFGAVAAGPFFGGLQANVDAWRQLFWVVAGVGFAAFLLTLLTFNDTAAADPDGPTADHLRVARRRHRRRRRRGVDPADRADDRRAHRPRPPIHLGVLLLPFLGGALLTALIFGALLHTRFIPLLAWSGLISIAGGAAVLTGVAGSDQAIVLVGSGLVGLGVGASVTPALFTVGFTLHAKQLPRVFAMLELMRGAAAVAAGPIILHVAETTGSNKTASLQIAIWICFAIVLSGACFALYFFILGRAKLQKPDLVQWMEAGEPAWYSPPLAAGIRAGASVSSNGNGAVSLGTRDAARVEALAHAAGLADGKAHPSAGSQEDQHSP